MKSYIPNPTIIEQTARGEKQYDIYSRLLLDRIIFLGTEINDTVSNLIVAQMLFLEQTDPTLPIHMYINSPGGGIYAGLAIYDTMQHVSCKIHTYCIGLAASMGSLLLQAGSAGHRYSMPNSRIMLHQPLGGAQGQASDIEIQAKEILDLKKILMNIYSKHSSFDQDVLTKILDRDSFLDPSQAKKFQLIDHIIEPKKKP